LSRGLGDVYKRQVLHQLADQAKAIFATHPNVKYVRDDWRQESKVLKPIINQDKMRQAGINRADIAFALKRASDAVSYTHLTLPTNKWTCRSR
ncbi:efflux RND transporter permease subunit, partial [Vibrio harveyi]|uniref:efflux RND transporter permease subunit n=1 Tax=Vibrio harveyi TaxID=669 RepID=UPI0018F11E67